MNTFDARGRIEPTSFLRKGEFGGDATQFTTTFVPSEGMTSPAHGMKESPGIDFNGYTLKNSVLNFRQ